MPRLPRVPEQPRGRRAHTLTEMLVVLAILGVMAGAVVPALLPTRDEDEVTRTARTLVELLHRSRASAAELGAAVTLVIDPATGRVWMSAGDDTPLVEYVEAESLTESLSRARHAGRAVAIAAVGPRVRWTFAPSGPAFGEPVLVHDATRGVVVGVDCWTGEPYAKPR